MLFLRKYFDYLLPVLFFLSALTLVNSWYEGVGFFGGGEEGLSLWRPEKSYSISKNVWIDVGLGYPSPFFLPRTIFYGIATLLSNFFESVVLQKLFFAGSMTVGFLGTYLFVKNLINKSFVPAVFAAMFYVFNLYTQSQVFARFVYTGIFGWAFLPLFLYLFGMWLKTGQIRYLLLFLVANLFASHTYSHPAYVLIVWFVLFFWFLACCLKSSQKLKLTAKFIITLILWITINIWWIYPMFKLSGAQGGNPSIRGWEYDFATLQGLSRDYPNSDIFMLRQKYYFEKSGLWGDFYNNKFSYGLSLLSLFFVAIGLFKNNLLKAKPFLVILFFLSWFLVKGANPPFGEIFYQTAFSFVPYLGMFRNSYEKLGIIFLLPYSIFFASGVFVLSKLINSKFRIIYLFSVFALTLGLVWPLLTGKVFSSYARVSVPEYYQEVNIFLNESDSQGRILSMPFVPGEGVNYSWKNGSYYGLEPSEFLFDRPSVSWVIPNSIAGEKLNQLSRSVSEGNLPRNLIEELGVDAAVLHNDANTTYSGSITREESRKLIEKSGFRVSKIVGDLAIYSFQETHNGLVTVESECSQKPEFEYKKINSGKYVVSIKDSVCSFALILKTTFHDFWQARIGETMLKDHFMVYHYANGWKVDKRGSYTVEIIFKVW